MTTATATPRRILIADHRDEATLRAAGYVPVQEATADSVGVFATGYSDITETRDVPAVLDPDTGAELAPAYTETVIVQSAQHQAEKACEAWLMSLPALPAPALVYSVSDYTNAVQAALDAAAQKYDFDDIFTAATYEGDADPEFAAHAAALKKWRSKMWRACYAAQANPPTITPTPEQFVAALLANLPAP